MAELIAKAPLQGQAPVIWGGITLEALPACPVYGVALYPGAPAGLLPAPGQMDEAAGTRRVWTGRGTALVFGAVPDDLAAHAAVTDQSGAWAGIGLSGAGVTDVLARLVPLDLRPGACPPGAVRRSSLGHIPAVLIRLTLTQFEIRVPRSMARSAWEELSAVLDRIEARSAR